MVKESPLLGVTEGAVRRQRRSWLAARQPVQSFHAQAVAAMAAANVAAPDAGGRRHSHTARVSCQWRGRHARAGVLDCGSLHWLVSRLRNFIACARGEWWSTKANGPAPLPIVGVWGGSIPPSATERMARLGRWRLRGAMLAPHTTHSVKRVPWTSDAVGAPTAIQVAPLPPGCAAQPPCPHPPPLRRLLPQRLAVRQPPPHGPPCAAAAAAVPRREAPVRPTVAVGPARRRCLALPLLLPPFRPRLLPLPLPLPR